jgi:hypothetical protein
MSGWKIATVVASLAAVGAAGYAWHLRRTLRKGWTPPPPPAPGPNKDATALASLQVLKGSKAVAEASKKTQLGDVRAHDRDASKGGPKGG